MTLVLYMLDELIAWFSIDRHPLISIVLPMYNAQSYIGECMQSILEQTYLRWELIVVDDGSTDHSAQILNGYIAEHINLHTIKLITLQENVGIAQALNIAISHCSEHSAFIARMDADDICLKLRLETQLTFMVAHPEIDVLGTGVHLFEHHSNKHLKDIIYPCMDTTAIKWCCLFYCPLHHPTVMMRKNKRFSLKYDDTYKHCEDYDLWFKLLFAERCQVANLNSVQLKLRKKQNENISQKYSEQQKECATRLCCDYVNNLLSCEDMEISMAMIDCIRNPWTIESVDMFKQCFVLLEKWEQFVLNSKSSDFVKNDCDSRMAELSSYCMRSSIMHGLQMMQIWKQRNPKPELLRNLL